MSFFPSQKNLSLVTHLYIHLENMTGIHVLHNNIQESNEKSTIIQQLCYSRRCRIITCSINEIWYISATKKRYSYWSWLLSISLTYSWKSFCNVSWVSKKYLQMLLLLLKGSLLLKVFKNLTAFHTQHIKQSAQRLIDWNLIIIGIVH